MTIAEKDWMFGYSLKRVCPYCHGRNIRKSRPRGFMEKYVLPFVLLRPFRCMKCDSRFPGLFFASRIKEEASEEQNPYGPAGS